MAGLIEYTGMNQRPMFINYTPYNLDLSPYRENQQVKLQMAAELAKQAQLTRQKAQDLEIPDLPGITTSTYLVQSQAIAAKQKMIELASANFNPNTLPNNPEWRKAQQQYMTATSSYLRRGLEQELKEADDFAVRMKGVASGPSLLLTTPEGVPIVDPDDPSRLLRSGEAHDRTMTDTRYSRYEKNGFSLDLAGSMLADPQEYRKELYEGFRQSGTSEASTTWKSDYAALSEVAAGSSGSAQEQLLAAITLSGRGKTNRNQIEAGIAAELNSMDPRKQGAMLNAFVQTSAYQDGITKSIKKGGFLKEDGSVDPQAVVSGMMSSRTEQPVIDLGGKGERVSYAQNFILWEAARAASDSDLYDPTLIQAKGGSGRKMEEGNANYFQDQYLFGQLQKTDPATGLRIPDSEPFPVTVPVTRPDGMVEPRKTMGERTITPETIHNEHKKQIGLIGSDGRPVPDSDKPKVSAVYPGVTGRLPGGKEIKLDDYDAVLVDEARELVFLPAGDPAKGKSGGYGANVMIPHIVADLVFPEGNLPTDFIDQLTTTGGSPWDEDLGVRALSTLSEVSIDDDDYRERYPQQVGPGKLNDGGAYFEGDNFEFGSSSTRARVLIPVPSAIMQEKGKYLYDRQLRTNMINPRAEAERSYQDQLNMMQPPRPSPSDSYLDVLKGILQP